MKYFKQFCLALSIIFLAGCNESDTASTQGKASLSVTLVDAPGAYEHVYVEIIDVMLKYENNSDEEDNDGDDSGWVSLSVIEPGIYDLLELTGGINLPLVENEEIDAGLIKQIRLVLGNSNSVVFEDETEERPLNTPSAQQSGLKVFVNQEVLAGFNYNFILDFDAHESIVVAGNSGNINLRPVLRANLEVNSGILQGNVLPADVEVSIEASNASLTAATITDEFGNFEINGLPAGLYTVTLTPDEDSSFDTVVLTDIEITVGNTTVLETITFE